MITAIAALALFPGQIYKGFVGAVVPQPAIVTIKRSQQFTMKLEVAPGQWAPFAGSLRHSTLDVYGLATYPVVIGERSIIGPGVELWLEEK